MINLFKDVLMLSLLGSFVIVLVIVLRFIMRKVPKTFAYFLWFIPLIRLVTLSGFTSKFNVMNGLPQKVLNVAPETIDKITNFQSYTVVKESTPNFFQLLSFIWILGVCLIITYTIIKYLKLNNSLKNSINLSENIYISDEISFPFTIGIFKSKIYIPTIDDSQEYQYIMEHESTHLKRKDNIIKLVWFLVACVHWFNPIVWFAYKLMILDMEMSCDEHVVKSLNLDCKKKYSCSLVKYSCHQKLDNAILFSDSSVKVRVKNILKYHKASKRVVTLSICIFVFALFIGLSNPLAQKVDNNEGNQSNINNDFQKVDDENPINTNVVSTESPALQSKAISHMSDDYVLTEDEFIFPLSFENIEMTYGCYPEHIAIDLNADEGTQILAIADGNVIISEFDDNLGNYIKIEYANGYTSLYANCSELKVSSGDKVSKGDIVALVGNAGKSTGAHLHFEVTKDDELINPLDLYQ